MRARRGLSTLGFCLSAALGFGLGGYRLDESQLSCLADSASRSALERTESREPKAESREPASGSEKGRSREG